MKLQTGTRLGHYEILAPLGAGGMGEVYRARDLNLEREVAVKVLPELQSAEADALHRFEREVRAIAALNHPNILIIHDYGDHEGCRYAVTELLEGETLASRLARLEKLPWSGTLDLAIDLARGLAAAHEKGVIHRDIKPSNLFLLNSGTAKILDFGLARSADPALAETIEPGGTLPLRTMPGTVLGTVGYMSPEQARGEPTDVRTDIFSFGCVLFEMLTGQRPFQRKTAADTLAAILNSEPPELARLVDGIPVPLADIVTRCLNKSLDHRFANGAELVAALQAAKKDLTPSEIHPQVIRRRINRPLVGAVVVAALALVAWSVGSRAYRNSIELRARTEVLPEIERLSLEGKYVAALRLAEEASEVIPDDAKLAELIAAARQKASILSKPLGALVFYKDYDDPDGEWIPLGKTPLQNVSVPKGLLRWKLELEGYQTFIGGMPTIMQGVPFNPLEFTLEPDGEAVEGMLYVQPGFATLPFTGFDPLDFTPVPAFHIDRYEVTNSDYAEFVDAGGYADPRYWKVPVLGEDGLELPFDAAVSRFVDATGRPGPSTWELGRYPEGAGDLPVSGVSWFEAAAYAEFTGNRLPTMHQWGRAALSPVESGAPVSPKLVPLSNFSGKGPRPSSGLQSLSPFGAVNMAGNVREWCWTEEEQGRRYILGGAWDEPTYMLTLPNAVSPLDRSATNGFRCVRYVGDLPPTLLAAIPRQIFNFEVRPPLSEDAFRMLGANFRNAAGPLSSSIEEVDDSGEDWILQKALVPVDYEDDPLRILVYLPRGANPPFQAVVYYPGADFIFRTDHTLIEGLPSYEPVTYVPRSGRALILPVYFGTLERARLRRINAPGNIERGGQDLARTLQYLESRGDIDMERLAYMGFSMGSIYGNAYLPYRPEFKAAVLVSGGLAEFPKEEEFSMSGLLPYIKLPVLMLNGKYDYLFPYEASQKPFFDLLGTPESDKRHVAYEAGHWPIPRHELIRESLDWFDKYLGPVSRIEPELAASRP